MRKKQTLILAVLGAALGIAGCASSRVVETDRLLDAVEARVVMPNGAGPISAYTRYYVRLSGAELRAHGWKKEPGEGDKVLGVYIRGSLDGSPPGRRWEKLDRIPVIMDGGCGIVNIAYDVPTDLVEMAICNGVA